MFTPNKTIIAGLFSAVALTVASLTQAAVIINNSTGGLYNNALGDMADYYGPAFFPAANVSEGDPNNNALSEPMVFGAAFGTNWLLGNYTGGSWGAVADVPDTWAVNMESAIVYDFNLASISDLHIDLGVDNGVYVWLDGVYQFGAMAPGGASLNEYDIDISGLGSGNHQLQFLREDHGGGTGWQVLVDATASTVPVAVPEPEPLALLALGLVGLIISRRRK